MRMRIGLAQLNSILGDVNGNLSRAHKVVAEAKSEGVDLVVFPELFLTGYSLAEIEEDVSLEVDDERIRALAADANSTGMLIGFQEGQRRPHTYNSAAYIEDGRVVHTHRKAYLATYGQWEESKHFTPGSSLRAFDTRFGRMATLICFDVWQPAFVFLAIQDGAQVLLVPSNSVRKEFADQTQNHDFWSDITRFYASMFECYVVFVNRVGDEGELNFWGGSHVVDPQGNVVVEAPRDEEALVVTDIDLGAVDQRRRETPLLKEARLGVLMKELERLASRGGHL